MGIRSRFDKLEQHAGAGKPVCPRGMVRIISDREESLPDDRPECICGGIRTTVEVRPKGVEEMAMCECEQRPVM